MKILHVAASLDPEYGGPVEVVTGLTQALAKKGVEVSVFAPSGNDKGIYTSNLEGVKVRFFLTDFFSKFWLSHSPSLAKTLMKEASSFDLIHIHEIWHHPSYSAYRAARSARKPFIITIHGELEPWCLRHKAFKKKIYSVLIQRKILKEASALHAITKEEVNNISSFVANKNVLHVPNGLNPEQWKQLPGRALLENLYPQVKGKKVILFLGRIHPKKGLDILARSFGKISREQKDVCLLIVGPNDSEYQNKVEKMIETEGILDKVIFTGMLTGHAKMAALSGADIFVLSSYSEGFSIAILQAMICGLPVIVTHQCNFPEIEEIKAGVVIDPNVDQLTDSLTKLLNKPQLCKEMGENGRRLIIERFTWDKVAAEMINSYENILADSKTCENFTD